MADVTPITRVLDADGAVLHDCAESHCEVSWDGYTLPDGPRVEGATDPSDAWDTSTAGVAKRKPSQD